jgi:hypothetical protein
MSTENTSGAEQFNQNSTALSILAHIQFPFQQSLLKGIPVPERLSTTLQAAEL